MELNTPTFEAWWNGDNSPARHMSSTGAHFSKWIAAEAFEAGLKLRDARRTEQRVKREKFSVEKAERFSL